MKRGWEEMLKKWRLMSLFTILALVLAGCGEPFISTLQPAGEVADQQYFLMILSTLIMVVVVVVVSFIFVFVIVKYRRSKLGDDHIPKQVEGNRNLEILWTVIPIILLLILVVPVVAQTFDLAGYETDG